MNFTITAYHNLDIKFLSELLALYLEFIKCVAKKIDSHIQIVLNKSFQIIESSIILEFKLINMNQN